MTSLPGTSLTHDQLASDLAAHLRGGSKRITWEDMQLGPVGSPRPDVYAMEPTYTRLTFEAFECKVSVSDFRSDITSGKWQKYLLYANSVTFAVPAGLINKDQVPTQCGLIVRGVSGQWKYAKKPTKHVLKDLPWQAWIKLLLDGAERVGYTAQAAHWSNWQAQRVLAKKFGEEVASMVADLKGLPERYRYEKEQHDGRVLRLRDGYQRELAEYQSRRADAEARCNDATGKLAVALGLPANALLLDLQGRAQQLLQLLAPGAHQHQFGRLADQMERMVKELRSAEAVLTNQRKEDRAA